MSSDVIINVHIVLEWPSELATKSVVTYCIAGKIIAMLAVDLVL